MTTKGSGSGPNDESKDSWATESVPMAVRRQLLEKELRTFAARGSQGRSSSQGHDEAGEGPSGHPQADDQPGDERPE